MHASSLYLEQNGTEGDAGSERVRFTFENDHLLFTGAKNRDEKIGVSLATGPILPDR